jgi:hypothetical protein
MRSGALGIVSPDRSEPRALASGIPLPGGRGSDLSGETMPEALYCYMKGRYIVVLHAFVKKSKGRLNSDEHSTVKKYGVKESVC